MNKKNQSTVTESEQNQWFTTWFDTPFYHILYNKRSHSEAEAFIKQLIGLLKPQKGTKALDLACGAGRHAITLSNLGLDVLGIDLAANSIDQARKSAHEFLHFEVHDMRDVIKLQHFDYIFNLFTSFGYFESYSADKVVIDACYSQLKPKGIMVFDYLNVNKVISKLPFTGIELRDEIEFNIEKKLENNHIIKNIDFTFENKPFHFQERIAAYTAADFEKMFLASGFTILHIFGDYLLNKYTIESERVIIIALKN